MNDKTVQVEKQDGYHVITLNRPSRLNSFTEEMHHELRVALEAAELDPDCRALLLTGAGRGFCAGQDLNDRVMATDDTPPDLAYTTATFYGPLILKLRSMPFPVVCAVNGSAAGAGANIALACDIVLAARSAKFLQAFSRIGLVPDAGGTYFLPRLIGDARARGLALLAEPLDAETAEKWGLIWRAVDDAALMIEAHALCAKLAKGPTRGLASIKLALNASPHHTLEEQLALESRLQGQLGRGADYAEGVKAFMEKRKPEFKGKS